MSDYVLFVSHSSNGNEVSMLSSNRKCTLHKLSEIEKTNIIATAKEFVSGEIKKFNVWSNNDQKNPLIFEYIAIDNSGNCNSIKNMEALVLAIHSENYDIYRIEIEEDIF